MSQTAKLTLGCFQAEDPGRDEKCGIGAVVISPRCPDGMTIFVCPTNEGKPEDNYFR